MGWIAKLLSFDRVTRQDVNLSDVKVDLGGGEIVTATNASPSGDDTVPLDGDFPIAVDVSQKGRKVVVAYVETDSSQKSQKGDKRIYARDGDRLEIVELWLKSDGSATLSNAVGSFTLLLDGSQKGSNANGFYELKADGTMDINSATIDPAGNIIATSVSAPSIVANNKELAGHNHNETGSVTGPNN